VNRRLTILLVFFITLHVFSQDKLYLKSGKVKNVKIFEVTDSIIIYQLHVDSAANKLHILKSRIAKIEYGNGSTDKLKERKPEDKNTYLAGGIIPYQLFARSCGGYISFDKRRFKLDYRYTYTFPLKFVDYLYLQDPARYRFQGHNHSLITSFGKYGNCFGVLTGYKIWRYSNLQTLLGNYDAILDSKVHGLNVGIEFSHSFSKNRFHRLIYVNSSVTFFRGDLSITPVYAAFGSPQTTTTDYRFRYFHLAVGMYLGARFRLNKEETD
jgi:hypothetical protein